MTVYTRWVALKDDLTAIHEIEQQSFDDPWSKEEIESCLRQRFMVGMVAIIEGQIAGFMIYEFGKHHLRVISLATATAFRRQGVATALIARLTGKLSPGLRERVSVEIREANLDAQLFFKSQGFSAVHIVRKPYEGCDEDAYRMEYPLIRNFVSVNRISHLTER